MSALNDDWDAERLDAELGGLEDKSAGGPAWPDKGRAIWWCERDGLESTPVVTTGLPEASAFARLLAGAPQTSRT